MAGKSKVAKEEMLRLLDLAGEVYSDDKALANRYVTLSRKIATKHRLRYPREYKRRFCKTCYTYLMPGDNARIRTREGTLIVYCLECKNYMRFPYKS